MLLENSKLQHLIYFKYINHGIQNNDNIKIIKELTEVYPSLPVSCFRSLQYHNHEGFINLFPPGIFHAIIFARRCWLVLV